MDTRYKSYHLRRMILLLGLLTAYITVTVHGCEDGKFGQNCTLECHCGEGVACQNGACTPCSQGWAGPTCQLILENVARNKITDQGPNTKDGSESGNAVDGDLDQTNNTAWAQLNNETGFVWWRVDLGSVLTFSTISVLFHDPQDEVQKEIAEKKRLGYSIRISNTSTENDPNLDGSLCYHDNSDQNTPSSISLSNCTSPGRYVVLYNTRSTGDTNKSKWPNLELTEVQVFVDSGCSSGTFGQMCEKECPVTCLNNKCDRVTGHCTDGCQQGYFSRNCSQQCSPHCSTQECDDLTGSCPVCKDGYTGERCDTSCPQTCDTCTREGKCQGCMSTAMYGEFCNITCSANCIDGCFQVNGTCRNGCSVGKFGDTCNFLCDHCDQPGCHRNGSCLASGCQEGYYGDGCNMSCVPGCYGGCERLTGVCDACSIGHYGEFCQLICPANCDSNSCHKDGSCRYGCHNKTLYGLQCDQVCGGAIAGCEECESPSNLDPVCLKCNNRMYGDNCNKSCLKNCDFCFNDTICTSCVFGYSGPTCEDICDVLNCESCGPDGECIQCKPGLYGSNCNNSCPDCKTCEEKENGRVSCTSCNHGSYLKMGSSTNICSKCRDTCISCANDTSCSECKDGHFGASCQTECPDHCVRCSSDQDCSLCDTGWYGKSCQCNENCINDGLVPNWCSENGTCLKGCVSGFLGNKCQMVCQEECMQCDQQSAHCTKCVAGKYGSKELCSLYCGHCKSGECEISDGTCHSGCKVGFHGAKCNMSCSSKCGDKGCKNDTGDCISCPRGFYGQMCDMKCSDQCSMYGCDMDSGKCVSCQQGYYGSNCDESCHNNCLSGCKRESGTCEYCKSKFYGLVCDQECPENCGPDPNANFLSKNKIECNRQSGECIFCKAGYFGEICSRPCQKTCVQQYGKPVCKKYDGKCDGGCVSGYYGDFCMKECNENCGKLAEADAKGVCDFTTGHCTTGCIVGWYNRSCDVHCSSTCKGESCDQLSGDCMKGCISGYKGQYCKIRQPDDDSGSGVIVAVIVSILIVLLLVIGAILFILYRRHSHKNQVKRNGYREDLRLSRLNGGSTQEQNPLLYANSNGSTGVNRLPVPARNTKPVSMVDEELMDDDDTMPLMSNTNPSDYYNLSSLIPVAGFTEYLQNRKMESIGWYKEDFCKLPRGLLKNCHIAGTPSNRGKCRYKQLYPYDDNRVKLDPELNIKSDFINASYIGGHKKPEAFIAAQGPTDVNLNDFWRMIFQKDCGRIVMLTNLFEECKMKCVCYWPAVNETQIFGNYEVFNTSETVLPDYTVRSLEATRLDTKEVKLFKQFHFTAWPDRGVPDNPSCILNFRDKVMDEDPLLPDGQILVHCSAGIGRTGTFIALDYLLRQAHEESHIDVFRTITDMRYQRTNFVQTDIQYEFLHNAIAEALTTKVMEVNAADFCTHYWSLLENNPDTGRSKLEEQFEMLNKMSPVYNEGCFLSGTCEDNLNKNRYREILPLDMYRAFLSTPVKGCNEYINAVFLPTCSSKTAFLLTQMPLPHTVTDFWRLVYDQNVTNIVMMNNVNDDDESIGEYWPSDDCTYGPFKVELLSCENNEDFSTMCFQLTYTSSNRQKTMTVKQHRYEGWAEDETVPSLTRALTSMIGAVSRSVAESPDGPTIVHCMDGAVRSGLYCVLAAIYERLQVEQKVNIPQTILQLRSRRPQLIPTLEQYDFCHRAVTDYMEATQIYSNVI